MLRILMIALLALAIVGCQNKKEEPKPVGAYRDTAATSDEVHAAALYAVERRSNIEGKTFTLTKVITAEQQVVAGMNYKMALEVSEDGVAAVADVVVYVNLEGKKRLKSWVWR